MNIVSHGCIYGGTCLISGKTLVLHMLHTNVITNTICEYKYFSLNGYLISHGGRVNF